MLRNISNICKIPGFPNQAGKIMKIYEDNTYGIIADL
jgi:hypothetical protein